MARPRFWVGLFDLIRSATAKCEGVGRFGETAEQVDVCQVKFPDGITGPPSPREAVPL